ncbi:MAG TPA: hypothetical protein VG077_03835 [Verrucomicrobiae bacterium]|nr:hypothetical protein [Verrucomicrobiae bacterium]
MTVASALIAFTSARMLWTNHRRSLITIHALMIAPLQSEFPLRVAVCAWCKPKRRGVDPGTNPDPISHGICPRHFKKLKLELLMKKDAGHPAQAVATPSRRRRTPLNHPELSY